MVSGRARFVNNVEECFTKFIRLFKKNKETWQGYLMDHGKNEVPLEYLIAFEEGLRNYADDQHALGTHPLRSPGYYASISLWRKREAYIALGRHLLGREPDYKQWDCFLFQDYQERQSLGKTYQERHHPLSDGNDKVHFGNKFKFPWVQYVYSPKKRARVVKSEPKLAAKHLVHDPSTPPKCPPMIYDVEKGCLVPFE